MKQTIRIYIHTLLFILIPFTLFSLILAILSYFIQLNGQYLNIIIQVISYLILIFAALYFTSALKHNRMKHCLCISLFYFLVSLLIHLGNLNYIHLLAKSLLFVLIGFYKEIKA